MVPHDTDFVWSTPITQLSSSEFFQGAEPNNIVGIMVTDDNGVTYGFVIEKDFLGPSVPAFILQSIQPHTDISVMNELSVTKFWVYGGHLRTGGQMTLKQATHRQRVLKESITIARIQVRRSTPSPASV